MTEAPPDTGMTRVEALASGLAAPSRSVSDIIWLAITFGFLAVFIIGFTTIAVGMFWVAPVGIVPPDRIEQMAMLAASFLTGLLAGQVAPSVRR